MVATTRTDLNVPYAEKEDAKALGARWDPNRRVWYAPTGLDLDLDLFGRWLLKGLVPPEQSESPDSAEPESGMALKDLLAQVRVAVEGCCPNRPGSVPRSASYGARTATCT
jgi:exodeoxyribonuclease VII large subunit